MNDHDCRHRQRHNVYHIRGALEYDRIGNLDISRVTVW